MWEFWQDLVWTEISGLAGKLTAVLPGLLAMLTLLALGALLGWAARTILSGLARATDFDRRSKAWGVTAAWSQAGIAREPSQVLAALVFWGIFAVFATLGIDALAPQGTPGLAAALVQFVPRLVAGALILVVGWLAANFLSQGVLIAAVNSGVPEARLLARGVRWGVLLFTVGTTLTQIGIGKEMVLVAFGLTFGGLILGLALAFGLGGRAWAREILERRRHREREPHPLETISHL